MKALVSMFEETTSEFNTFGVIVTLAVLTLIVAGVVALVVGLFVQGEPIRFAY